VAAPKPKPAATTSTTHVVTHSSDNPSEAPVTKAYVSTAVGDEPKYLRLPSINAGGYIIKVGIDQNSQVASPGNVNFAGWYVNSLKPGQLGLSIIDGHVDGKKGPGIFLRLAKLKPADTYDVELANGTKLQYAVQRVSSLKVADVPAALFAHDPSIDSQLNLITCYGTFNYQSGEYDQRTIVVSKLIKQI
jgi:sortase (surface protein transpeptidase)